MEVRSVLTALCKQRNVDVGFTSNPAKYIKYQPDTLEEMISIFFEGQAEVRKVRKFGKAK